MSVVSDSCDTWNDERESSIGEDRRSTCEFYQYRPPTRNRAFAWHMGISQYYDNSKLCECKARRKVPSLARAVGTRWTTYCQKNQATECRRSMSRWEWLATKKRRSDGDAQFFSSLANIDVIHVQTTTKFRDLPLAFSSRWINLPYIVGTIFLFHHRTGVSQTGVIDDPLVRIRAEVSIGVFLKTRRNKMRTQATHGYFANIG